MSRLPPIDLDALSPDQRRVYDTIASSPRGFVAGPMLAWLNSPEFADRAQQLGLYCRFGSALKPDLSELAILMVAVHWRAAFEWEAHEPIARAANVPEKVIAALREGRRPEFDDLRADVVYRFTAELLADRRVHTVTWERAEAELGIAGIVDLIGIIGYYAMIAMTLTAFEIPPISDGSAFMPPVDLPL